MSLSDITNTISQREKRVELLDKSEPLLMSNDKRFVLFPIHYDDIYKAYKGIVDKFWNPKKFGMANFTLSSLSSGNRGTIEKIMLFWCKYSEQSLIFKMNNDIQIPEARCFFGFQISSQINHKELFAILARNININYNDVGADKMMLLESLFKDESFGGRLIAYSAMEFISICSLYVLKALLQQSNEIEFLVKRIDAVLDDKMEYGKFGTILFRYCSNVPDEARAHSIIQMIVDAEISFLKDIVDSKSSITSEAITNLVRFEADKVCDAFKYQRIYNAANPFE